MKTASGALSVGAPHSAARYRTEAKHASDNVYQLLLLTDEGKELLARFAKSIFCDFSKMTNEYAADWMDRETTALNSFLCGVQFLYSKI